MPDERLERTRKQYDPVLPFWRRPSDNAAEQLERYVARLQEKPLPPEVAAAIELVRTEVLPKMK